MPPSCAGVSTLERSHDWMGSVKPIRWDRGIARPQSGHGFRIPLAHSLPWSSSCDGLWLASSPLKSRLPGGEVIEEESCGRAIGLTEDCSASPMFAELEVAFRGGQRQ